MEFLRLSLKASAKTPDQEYSKSKKKSKLKPWEWNERRFRLWNKTNETQKISAKKCNKYGIFCGIYPV